MRTQTGRWPRKGPHLQEALGGLAGQQVVLGVGDVLPHALALVAQCAEAPVFVQGPAEHLVHGVGGAAGCCRGPRAGGPAHPVESSTEPPLQGGDTTAGVMQLGTVPREPQVPPWAERPARGLGLAEEAEAVGQAGDGVSRACRRRKSGSPEGWEQLEGRCSLRDCCGLCGLCPRWNSPQGEVVSGVVSAPSEKQNKSDLRVPSEAPPFLCWLRKG